jgi:hypothetical protein
VPTEEYEIHDPDMKAILNELGRSIGDRLPPGWGMCLLLFEFNGEATFYISNARRQDMIKALQEFVRNQKQRGH